MDVVYVIQHGADGPIYVDYVNDSGLQRRRKSLQAHSPETVHLRAVLNGSLQLDAELRVAWSRWHIHGRWYRAEALAEIPPDAPRREDLERAERLRASLQSLTESQGPA